MRRIGLTGGIGCGKTTVVREFEKIGIPCFVADTRAAAYYQEADFIHEVCTLLGDDILNADGTVNKKRIADKVFGDREALAALNGLVHPRVMQEFAQWAEAQQAPYVIMESAIIFEYGLQESLDKVIAVYLDKEERMLRLEQRDHVSREALEMRMRNQLSAEEKMDRADFVILNYEGNPRQRQVMEIDLQIRKEFRKL